MRSAFTLFIVLFYEVKGCAFIKRKDSLKVDDVKETSEIVHAALMTLIKLHGDIKNARVTGKEVETYRKEANNLHCLYEAVKTVISVPQYAEVSSALEVCVKKLNTVKVYRLKLIVVVHYYKRISEGM